MPSRHLELRTLESRVNQLVIDLHDAARICYRHDVGVAESLRRRANDLHDIVRELRRLLPAAPADMEQGMPPQDPTLPHSSPKGRG